VDEEVEGTLLDQGPGGVDGDEVHAARGRLRDERGLDEAMLLLGRERVADGVAVLGGIAGGGLGGHRVGRNRRRWKCAWKFGFWN
jgi:hypothetical protein